MFACEPISELAKIEIMPLLHAHRDEVGFFKEEKISPYWELYDSLQREGVLRFFTARENDILVGYALFYIMRDPHFKNSTKAIQDLTYLSPKHRNGLNGYNFIKWVIAQMKRENIHSVYLHVTPSLDYSKILKRLGLENMGNVYGMRLN